MGAGPDFTCGVASLASGASTTFSVTYTVPASTPAGSQTNTAVVSSPVPDPTPGNNTAADTNTVTTSANLSVTKSDGVTSVVAGASTVRTFTLTIANAAGSSDATGVSLADTWPAGYLRGTITPSAGTCVDSGVGQGFTCSFGTITPGTNRTVSVTYTVPASTPAGSQTNTAVVSSPVPDPTPGNNTASDTNTVTTSANLSVTKTDSPDPVAAGADLTWTITAANAGPSDAQSVGLTDTLPAGTTFVSLTSPGGLELLDPGRRRHGHGVLHHRHPGLGGQRPLHPRRQRRLGRDPGLDDQQHGHGRLIDVRSQRRQQQRHRDHDGHRGQPRAHEDRRGRERRRRGQHRPHVHAHDQQRRSHDGHERQPGRHLAGRYLRGSLPAGCANVGAGPDFTCGVAGLASGASTTFSVTYTVPASTPAGSQTNTAVVFSPVPDPTPGNNTAADTNTVTTSANLSVTKSDGATTVVAGTNLTYSLTVANAGPSEAQSFSLVDAVPTGTMFVSLTAPAGYTCTTPAVGGTGTATCTRPILPVGLGGAFTLVVNVGSGVAAGSTITNKATVA